MTRKPQRLRPPAMPPPPSIDSGWCLDSSYREGMTSESAPERVHYPVAVLPVRYCQPAVALW